MSQSMVNCLVTGASGFIGRELCALLATRGDSFRFRALSHFEHTLADGTATVALDLCSRAFNSALFQDIDVVYHLAGIAHQQAPSEAYEQVNHQATLRLARAASLAGVKHFVFLSSVKAMGPAPGSDARGEGDVFPAQNAYGRSKWLAEEGLRREFSGSAMAVTILRPALVYAAQAKGNLALLARGVRLGLPRPPEVGGRSMVALQDLLELLYQIADRTGPEVKTWIVTDGESYSSRRIYDALRRAGGKRQGIAWWPRWLWRLGLASLDMGRNRSESSWDKLFGTERYSAALLRRETGWRPRWQLEGPVTAAPAKS